MAGDIAHHVIVKGKGLSLGNPDSSPLIPSESLQVAALKAAIVNKFGADALQSPDLGRIVSDSHFKRVHHLLSDPRLAACLAYGGQTEASTR